MAVRGAIRILAVGDEQAISSLTTPRTKRIDLAGKTVTPGFIDSHIHMLSFGMGLLRDADLVGSGSIDEVLSRLSVVAGRTGGWIQGGGFDQDKLRERRFPTRNDLDRVSRDRPIIISRVCGHAVVVNSAALVQVSESARRAGNADTGLYTEGDSSPFMRGFRRSMRGNWRRRRYRRAMWRCGQGSRRFTRYSTRPIRWQLGRDCIERESCPSA